MQSFPKMNSKFYGDISARMTLADVFETLGSKKRKGWLFVNNSLSEKSLYFQEETVGIVSISEEKLSFIPEKLYYAGKLPLEQYQKIKRYKIPFASLEDYVEKAKIRPLVDIIAYDEICELFGWRQGNFYFVEVDSIENSQKKYPLHTLFETRDLLMEGARRLDEAKEIGKKMPPSGEILYQNILPEQKTSCDEPLGNVWQIAHGHSIEESLQLGYFSLFTTQKILGYLLNSKQLRLLKEEELLEYAKSAQEKGDWGRASKAYKALYHRNPAQPDLYDLLAECYRKENRVGDLQEIYGKASQYFLSCGKKTQSASYLYKRTQLLDPGSEESFQNKLTLLDQSLRREIDYASIGFDPLTHGLQILEKYEIAKDPARALELLKKIIPLNPDDIPLREKLLKMLPREDTEEILLQYEKIAKLYEKQNRFPQAEALYQKILQIAPSRIDIIPKLKALSMRQDDIKNKKKRILIVFLGVTIVLMGHFFCSRHRKTLQEEVIDAKDQIGKAITEGEVEKAYTLLPKLSEIEQVSWRQQIKMKEDEILAQTNAFMDKVDSLVADGELELALQTIERSSLKKARSSARTKILQQQAQIRELITLLDEKLQKAHKAEEKLDLETAVQTYLEIWHDRRFQKNKTRNLIQLPIQLSLNVRGAAVQIDQQEKETLAEQEKIIHVPCEFQKIAITLPGYKSATIYNALLTPKEERSFTGNDYFLQGGRLSIRLAKDILWTFSFAEEISEHWVGGDTYFYIPSRNDSLYAFRKEEEALTLHWKKNLPILLSGRGGCLFHEGVFYVAGNDAFYAWNTTAEKISLRGRFPLPKGMSNACWPTIDALHRCLFVSTREGEIYALPLLHKKETHWQAQWSFTLGTTVNTPPMVLPDKIVIGGHDGFLYALSPQSGEVLWRYKIGFPIHASMTIQGDMGYVGAYGTLYAFSLQEGKLLWRREIDGNVESEALVDEEFVYVGTTNGRLYAFARSGEQQWSFRTEGVLEHVGVIHPNGLLFITCKQGWLYAIQKQSGQCMWKYEIGDGEISSPFLWENKILIVGKKLYAFLDN